ncbi:MAG: DNA internalization-related competence protein ComEC/Rec2 [Nitrospirota bacterium]|nr:DNA internalization-related competence protein ComEC/Rec2 [Nitrospirota bacterium]
MPFFISFLCGVILFYLFNYFPFSSLILFVIFSASVIFRGKAFLVAVLAIGIFYAFLRFSPLDYPAGAWNRELRVTGRFLTQPTAVTSGTGIRTFAINRAFDPESGAEIRELRDREMGVFSDYNAGNDDAYELLLKTGGNTARLNPGAMKSARLYGSVIAARPGKTKESIFDTLNRYRNDLNDFVSGRFNSDSAGLIAAITTGTRGYLGRDIRDAFNITGLAHILSISGTHFGLFSIMLFGIFSFLIRRLPYNLLQRLTLYLTPLQAAAILTMPFMLMYLGISGWSVPALRSFLMISLFLAGLLIGRKGFWLNSLLFAAFVLVVWEPDVILSLSFQLSFIAVLFIGFSVEKRDGEVKAEEEEEEEKKESRVVRYIKNIIRLSVVVSIGTAPLVAYHFHYLSIISPLSNLLVAPLIGFVLIPLSLMSSFSFLLTGYYIFGPFVAVSAALAVKLVVLLSGIPFAAVRAPSFPLALLIFFYAGFFIYIVAGRKRKLLLLPFIPFLIYLFLNVFRPVGVSVTFLDVGQGDSAVIELPDKKTIVVDTGRSGKEAAAFLRYTGKDDIDVLILSHFHPDHSGGLEYLMERFNVGEIWDNGRIIYPPEMNINARHRRLKRGDIIKNRYCEITVLHPYKEFYTLFGGEDVGENDSSLVLKLTGENGSFVFTGDIGEEAEGDMLYIKKWLHGDVLKIPHHGSGRSADSEFISAISPSIAVISVGRDNSYGHPAARMLEQLAGAKVFRTDLDGAVKVTETENGFIVKTYRDFQFEKADSPGKEMDNIRRLFLSW